MKNDDIKLLRGFADIQTDICYCRVAFATENLVVQFLSNLNYTDNKQTDIDNS